MDQTTAKMNSAEEHDRLAVVPVQQSEVAVPNNEVVASDVMPVLDVQARQKGL